MFLSSTKSSAILATRRMNVRMFLVLLCSVATTATRSSQELVFFAGPHKAAATSIEEFFYKWAHRHTRKDKSQFALRFWKWPRIYGKIANETETQQPYKIFNHLVTEPNNVALKQEILEGIRKASDETQHGVILGGEEFDQVKLDDDDSYTSKYDSVAAIKGVVKHLGMHADNVTVILNYRTPRMEQWISIWKHATTHTSNDNNITYEEYLCNPQRYEERTELLATAMNPLGVAEQFLKEGWKVQMIDMGGVQTSGRDISHVIACDLLDGKCDDGNLRSHIEDTPHKNSVDKEFNSLEESEMLLSELLFRFRDCSFRKELQANSRFYVHMNETIWTDCMSPQFDQIYQPLHDDASLLFQALLSQVECPKDHVHKKSKKNNKKMATMDQVLSGNIPKQEELLTANTSGSIFTEVVLFPLILIAAAGYQVYAMMKSQTNNNKDKEAAVVEAEMSEMRPSSATLNDAAGYQDADNAGDEADFLA